MYYKDQIVKVLLHHTNNDGSSTAFTAIAKIHTDAPSTYKDGNYYDCDVIISTKYSNKGAFWYVNENQVAELTKVERLLYETT